MTNREEIERRRTFAIISHPDAGKTTLTEKLLLYGGAINQAGSVKGKQSAKHAVSDWMDIEKQRGISVTSSVLQFNYAGKCVNILDTPGHQDFSEDTYRTLMAADSAVMVIDAAKGVEAQTIKLFKVCTLRHIPIFTFINKMDREARDPFELMENIEEILGIKTYPMNWPIGCGKEFKGVFDRNTRKVLAFSSDGRANGVKKVNETEAELGDAALDELLTPYLHQQLVDEIELLDGAAEEFDLDKVLRGELSPVFFGSALTNFGVEPFLENFLRLTSAPLARVDSLTGEPVPDWQDIEAKKAVILKHGLAVWDTIGACDIRGASDASIRNVEPNDVAALIRKLGVQAVFCNGAASGRVYAKYAQASTGMPAVVLPSTSPANAAWSMDRLRTVWGRELLPFLQENGCERTDFVL